MEVVMKKVFNVLMGFLFVFAGAAYAEYYTWEDEHGVTQITDYPPPAAQKAKNLQQYGTPDPSAGKSNPPAGQAPSKPIINLYTKNNCPDCDKARSFLEAGGHPFIEYNMDADPTAVEKRKSVDDNEDVPFAIINKQRVYGFSESVYNRVLKSNP
jgi:glutaredoxin